MAWNIDYEHDSEEVIILKRHIAEQGCWHLYPPGCSSRLMFLRYSR